MASDWASKRRVVTPRRGCGEAPKERLRRRAIQAEGGSSGVFVGDPILGCEGGANIDASMKGEASVKEDQARKSAGSGVVGFASVHRRTHRVGERTRLSGSPRGEEGASN